MISDDVHLIKKKSATLSKCYLVIIFIKEISPTLMVIPPSIALINAFNTLFIITPHFRRFSLQKKVLFLKRIMRNRQIRELSSNFSTTELNPKLESNRTKVMR